MINKPKLLFVGALCLSTALFGVNAAMAKVFPIPSTDALATVNIPDDWEPTETDNGLEMQSPEGDIYLSIEGVHADKIAKALEESVKVLASQGLVIDTASQKTKDSELNGLKIHTFEYTAKDNDGPTEFAVTLVETRTPDRFVLVSAWGTADAQKTNGEALGKIVTSLQLTK